MPAKWTGNREGCSSRLLNQHFIAYTVKKYTCSPRATQIMLTTILFDSLIRRKNVPDTSSHRFQGNETPAHAGVFLSLTELCGKLSHIDAVNNSTICEQRFAIRRCR